MEFTSFQNHTTLPRHRKSATTNSKQAEEQRAKLYTWVIRVHAGNRISEFLCPKAAYTFIIESN